MMLENQLDWIKIVSFFQTAYFRSNTKFYVSPSTPALNLDLSGDRRSAAFATVDKRAETNS